MEETGCSRYALQVWTAVFILYVSCAGAYQSQTDQFSSQMTDLNNPYSNPLWISPYDNDETRYTNMLQVSLPYRHYIHVIALYVFSSTEVSSGTEADRDNPLYESQV